jgi:hypothetical protein
LASTFPSSPSLNGAWRIPVIALISLVATLVAAPLKWTDKTMPRLGGVWNKGDARSDLSVVAGDSGKVLLRHGDSTWREIRVGKRNFKDVVVTDSLVILVGTRVRAWSRDLVSWTLDTATIRDWVTIQRMDTLYFALGNRAVETSRDGKTWTTLLEASVEYKGAAQKGATQILVGTTGVISVRSGNGAWSTRPRLTNATITDVRCDADGVCLAVTDSGSVLRSTDGVTWTKSQAYTYAWPLTQVLPHAGGWVATIATSPSILWSEEGTKWYEADVREKLPARGLWIRGDEMEISGDNWPLKSGNGRHWVQSAPGTNFDLNSVRIGPKGWVASGPFTFVASTDSGNTWRGVWAPWNPWDIMPTAKGWTVHAMMTWATTTDLKKWTQGPAGTYSLTLGEAAWTGKLLVGTFTNPNNSSINVLRTSTDGTAWTDVTNRDLPTFGAMVASDRRAVATLQAGDDVFDSRDLDTWTRSRKPARTTELVVRDSTVFGLVAGRIVRSVRVGTWDTVFTDTTLTWLHLAAGAEGVLALGRRGTDLFELWSPDGVSWTESRSLLPKAPLELALGHGHLLAVGAGGMVQVARVGDTATTGISSRLLTAPGLTARWTSSGLRVAGARDGSLVELLDLRGRRLAWTKSVDGMALLPRQGHGPRFLVVRSGAATLRVVAP